MALSLGAVSALTNRFLKKLHYGVTSVVKNSTGNYTVTISSPMSDTNYLVPCGPGETGRSGVGTPVSATTFTINTAIPTAGAVTAILATVPGDIGNEVRLTASGTNVTAITNGTAGFLGHGTGGAVPYFKLP